MDRKVRLLAASLDLYQADVDANMVRSRALKAAGASDDDAAFLAACAWLTDNPARWAAWLPADCGPGVYMDDSLQARASAAPDAMMMMTLTT